MIDLARGARMVRRRWMRGAKAVSVMRTLEHRALAARLFALVFSVVAASCATLGDTRRESWTEEVQLTTGEVIRIERWVEQERVAEPFKPSGWIFRRAGLTARPPTPSAAAVKWEGTLAPLALDVANGAVYFVGVAITTQADREYRLQPGNSHVAFRLRSYEWERIKLSELPTSIKPNLLARTTTYLDDRGPFSSSLVTLEMKAKLDSVSGLARALRVIPCE